MNISPGSRTSVSLSVIASISLFVSACSSTAAVNPTATPSPTPTEAPTVTPPAAAETIWLEQPFGEGETLAVLFYTGPDGRKCVRFLVSYPPNSEPVSACQRSADDVMVVALGKAAARQAGGPDVMHTILAGRVFDEKTTTAAIEFAPESSPNTPMAAQIDQQGFIIILPGEKVIPTQVVPIDQFGNLVGEIYRFE